MHRSSAPIDSELTMSADEVRQHDKHDALIARCRGFAPIPMAVAHPCDESSRSGSIDAAEAGIILPFLVGPTAKIRVVAGKLKLNLSTRSPMSRTATSPPRRWSSWCASAKPSYS